MKYKQTLKESMELLAQDDKRVFLGYNVKHGSKANGTLINVSDSQLIETPVAENLMAGMAIGLSLKGYKPVVYFERFDFVLNALDSIVNHLDKMKEISKEEYNPSVIFRVVIGGKKNPLFTGVTHTQDFTKVMSDLVTFPVFKLHNPRMVTNYYKYASRLNTSIMLIEERDWYDKE